MRHLLVMGCVALGMVSAFVASQRLARAESEAPDLGSSRRFFVTSVAPSLGQRTSSDLSDPGLNNRIAVTFSTYPDPNDLFDSQNLVNGLSAKCDLHDHTLKRVRGQGALRRNVLSFDPFSAQLVGMPPARYTLTLSSSLRSLRGRPLNGGAVDFTTTFSVGTDDYPPVLRQVSPLAGQSNISPARAIVASFDEPMSRASALASVRLEDRSTNPPTPVSARIRLARHGLDVVVAPPAGRRHPRGADLTLVILGRGRSSASTAPVLTDAAGRPFVRDSGVQWSVDPGVSSLFHSPSGDFDEATGEFTMTFRTRGAPRPRR